MIATLVCVNVCVYLMWEIARMCVITEGWHRLCLKTWCLSSHPSELDVSAHKSPTMHVVRLRKSVSKEAHNSSAHIIATILRTSKPNPISTYTHTLAHSNTPRHSRYWRIFVHWSVEGVKGTGEAYGKHLNNVYLNTSSLQDCPNLSPPYCMATYNLYDFPLTHKYSWPHIHANTYTNQQATLSLRCSSSQSKLNSLWPYQRVVVSVLCTAALHSAHIQYILMPSLFTDPVSGWSIREQYHIGLARATQVFAPRHSTNRPNAQHYR